MAGPGNESHASPRTLHAEQDRPLLVFPRSEPPSPVCVRWSGVPVGRCPKHPNGSAFCRRFLKSKADDKGNKGDEPKPADAGLPLPPPPNSQLEADHHPADDMCPVVPPQGVESQARTPTQPGDESTSELEPADRGEPATSTKGILDICNRPDLVLLTLACSVRSSHSFKSEVGFHYPGSLLPREQEARKRPPCSTVFPRLP